MQVLHAVQSTGESHGVSLACRCVSDAGCVQHRLGGVHCRRLMGRNNFAAVMQAEVRCLPECALLPSKNVTKGGLHAAACPPTAAALQHT